jgi:hypothetical protein
MLKVWQAWVHVERLASICLTVHGACQTSDLHLPDRAGVQGQTIDGACQTSDKQVYYRTGQIIFKTAFLLLL